MELEVRRATREDMALLADLRLEVLCAANGLPPGQALPAVRAGTRDYYARRLGGDEHIEYLAFVEGALAACGAASLYSVMPTCANPSGQKAYIMNMYTRPAHRRQGLARHILTRLVADLHARGVTAIGLEATAAGRSLYESFGFVPLGDEMEYRA